MDFTGAILVVEDDPNDALLFQCALGQMHLNCKVSFVRDGIEARRFLEGQPPYDDRVAHPMPTILIIDLMMPRMNGFELLQWVRQQPELDGVFVVVLTGMEKAAAMARAYALGANLYMVKPLQYSELAGVVACAATAGARRGFDSNLSLLPA